MIFNPSDAARLAAACFALSTFGCGVVPAPANPAPAPAPASASGKAAAKAPAPPAAPAPSPVALAKAPPGERTAPATAKASPAKASPAKATPAAAAKAASAASGAPPIDLKSLEQKLKDSSAIGVMTKLSLKNQVDDLVAQFRAFHDGHRPPTLAALRQPFELLLMKVLALLQDKDPGLAKALRDSHDYLWSVLSDRDKFLQNA